MNLRRLRTGSIIALPAALVFTGLSAPSAISDSTPAQAPKADSRPNIVLILADDLGWSDISTGRTNMGTQSRFNETPALERLAAEGMAFNNAYASPTCTPSRAALLSGQYAPRKTNNIYQHGNSRGPLAAAPQGLPNGQLALPNATLTMAETLQSAGYATGYVGKFHVTRDERSVTSSGGHGFDVNAGGSRYGHPARYHAAGGRFDVGSSGLDAYAGNYTQAYVDKNIKPFSRATSPASMDALVGTNKHLTDAVADATINFMQRHANRPFFAFMGQYAVHTPVTAQEARRDLLTKYRMKSRGPAEPSNPAYGALLEGLDQSVARIVRYLETTTDPREPGRKLADNTLVVFTSDNGGFKPAGANNGPLRGMKASLHEGGLRVPMIAWSKDAALVHGGTINATPVSNMDFYPTFAALAGATVPAQYPLDGVNLGGILTDPTARLTRQSLFWHVPRYLVNQYYHQRPRSVMRSGKWKLAYSYEARTWQLYDLAVDIGETRNLAKERPDVVKDLGIKFLRWLDRMDAPLATVRTNVNIRVSGYTYADGRIAAHRPNDIIRLKPGDEMPLIAGF